MVAHKLLRTNAITKRTWEQLAGHFRQEWMASRKLELDGEKIQEGRAIMWFGGIAWATIYSIS